MTVVREHAPHIAESILGHVVQLGHGQEAVLVPALEHRGIDVAEASALAPALLPGGDVDADRREEPVVQEGLLAPGAGLAHGYLEGAAPGLYRSAHQVEAELIQLLAEPLPETVEVEFNVADTEARAGFAVGEFALLLGSVLLVRYLVHVKEAAPDPGKARLAEPFRDPMAPGKGVLLQAGVLAVGERGNAFQLRKAAVVQLLEEKRAPRGQPVKDPHRVLDAVLGQRADDPVEHPGIDKSGTVHESQGIAGNAERTAAGRGSELEQQVLAIGREERDLPRGERLSGEVNDGMVGVDQVDELGALVELEPCVRIVADPDLDAGLVGGHGLEPLPDLSGRDAEVQQEAVLVEFLAGRVALGYAEAAVEGAAGDEVNGDEGADQFDGVVFGEKILVFLFVLPTLHGRPPRSKHIVA